MAVYHYRTGPYSQANGTVTIELPQQSRQYQQHSVNVSFESGSIPAAGIMVLQARRYGATLFEALDDATNVDVRTLSGWPVIQDAIDAIRITPSNLPDDAEYYITINSFGV